MGTLSAGPTQRGLQDAGLKQLSDRETQAQGGGRGTAVGVGVVWDLDQSLFSFSTESSKASRVLKVNTGHASLPLLSCRVLSPNKITAGCPHFTPERISKPH